ncbi:flagellar hook-length control protein FliK [Octadecabacter sp.]|nr:flagellar hook-length control protein FliK [Octadecabacter sp.]
MILSQLLQGPLGPVAPSQGEQSAVPLTEDAGAFLTTWSEQPSEGDGKWPSVDSEEEAELGDDEAELPDDVMPDDVSFVADDNQRAPINRPETPDQLSDRSAVETGIVAHSLPQMSAPQNRVPHDILPQPESTSQNVKEHTAKANFGQASQHLRVSSQLVNVSEAQGIQTVQDVADDQVLSTQVEALSGMVGESQTLGLVHENSAELGKVAPLPAMDSLHTSQPKAPLENSVLAKELKSPRTEGILGSTASQNTASLTNGKPTSSVATAANVLNAPDLVTKIAGASDLDVGQMSLLGSIEELPTELSFNSTTSASLSSTAMNVANTVKTTAPTVVQQIAAALAQSSGQSTQIALNPEELGRVRISLSSNEMGLVVNIVAERPETADLMRRNIDSLLQDFSELGYDNPTFDFQSDGGTDGEKTSNQSATSSDGMSADVVLTQPETPTLRHTATGGLDLKL